MDYSLLVNLRGDRGLAVTGFYCGANWPNQETYCIAKFGVEPMPHVLLAALGGALGSSCRYLVGVWALRFFGPGYPWGTFIVNIVGSFLIGIFAETIALKFNASAEMRVLAVTGFLGGFTTFSAFSLDAVYLFERGANVTALIYVVSSVALSIAGLVGGLALVRSFG